MDSAKYSDILIGRKGEFLGRTGSYKKKGAANATPF